MPNHVKERGDYFFSQMSTKAKKQQKVFCTCFFSCKAAENLEMSETEEILNLIPKVKLTENQKKISSEPGLKKQTRFIQISILPPKQNKRYFSKRQADCSQKNIFGSLRNLRNLKTLNYLMVISAFLTAKVMRQIFERLETVRI